MAPRTSKKSSNAGKSNINSIFNINDIDNDDFNSDLSNIPEESLRLLRGYGSHANVPKFEPKKMSFNAFHGPLIQYLLIHNCYAFLNQENISRTDNLALFLAISNCLVGEALDIAQTQAFTDGQKLYKLLKQKYLGNSDAREATFLIDLCNLKLKDNETLTDFITRVDKLKSSLDEFKTINNTNLITCMVLRAINHKYSTFVENISTSGKMPPWDIFKEKLESYNAVLTINKPGGRSYNDNTVASVQNKNFKKRYQNKKRYSCAQCFGSSHKTHECNSNKYCKLCDNKSHDYENCRYKGKQDTSGRSRGRYIATRGRFNFNQFTPRNGSQNNATYVPRGGPRGAPATRGMANGRFQRQSYSGGRGNNAQVNFLAAEDVHDDNVAPLQAEEPIAIANNVELHDYKGLYM